jgi:hypothetical protein
LRALFHTALRVLAKLKRCVLVKRLCVHYVRGGGGDAFKAAMTYGGLSAAFGLAAGTLESALRVKRYDLRESVDFLADESKIYIDAAASLAVWEIISLAITALPLLSGTVRGSKINQTK